MRNQMALLLPDKAKARYLMSACNEEHSSTASFGQLGENLAQEIIGFMSTEVDSRALATFAPAPLAACAL